jgi:hypothetical protein
MFRFATSPSGSARPPLADPSRLFTVVCIICAFYTPIVWSFHAQCSHNVIHQKSPFPAFTPLPSLLLAPRWMTLHFQCHQM